jgi:hypothetical protein
MQCCCRCCVRVSAVQAGWFNHYFTRSLEELALKNVRGDAVFQARPKTEPVGTGEVLNTHILDSVRLRLAALRAAGGGADTAPGIPGATVAALEATLLRGAPGPDAQCAEMRSAAAAPVASLDGVRCVEDPWGRQWTPEFVQRGQRFLHDTSNHGTVRGGEAGVLSDLARTLGLRDLAVCTVNETHPCHLFDPADAGSESTWGDSGS